MRDICVPPALEGDRKPLIQSCSYRYRCRPDRGLRSPRSRRRPDNSVSPSQHGADLAWQYAFELLPLKGLSVLDEDVSVVMRIPAAFHTTITHLLLKAKASCRIIKLKCRAQQVIVLQGHDHRKTR